MIRGIIFDFGNVICSFDNRTFTDRLSRGSRLTGDEIYRMLYNESDIVHEYETGRISSLEFHERITNLLDLSMDVETFRSAFTDIFSPIPGTIKMIRELKGKYSLGLLSNTNEWDHLYGIEMVGIYPLFDAVTVSYEVGVKKPDRRIYVDCLEKLGLEPHDCVFIDDIPEYVDMAIRIGLNGIHFQTPQIVRDHIQALNNSTKTNL